jgi:hypothetical protein
MKDIIINNEVTGYKVSASGRVFNKQGRELKQSNFNGYRTVSIKNKNYRVHRLVCHAYLPNPENKPHVNHKNGIKSDNRLENLEWVTPRENWLHAKDVLKVPTYGTDQHAELISKAMQKRWNNTSNKGIHSWSRGKKKFRSIIILNCGSAKTLGYFNSFAEAKNAYFESHKAVYGHFPTGLYCPDLFDLQVQQKQASKRRKRMQEAA